MTYIAVTMASSVDSFLDHEYSRTALGDNIDKASVKLLRVSEIINFKTKEQMALSSSAEYEILNSIKFNFYWLLSVDSLFTCLQEAYLSSENTNVVTSPLGVLLLLSLYSSGTQGKTRDEITQLLHVTDYKEVTNINSYFPFRKTNNFTFSLIKIFDK